MEKKAKTLKEHNAKTRIQAQDSWRHFTEASGNLEEARVEGKEAIFALEGEFKKTEVIQEEIEREEKDRKEAVERICFMEEEHADFYQKKKKIVNEIIEIKGNVRVFARLRPILKSEMIKMKAKLNKDYMPHSIQSKQKVIQLKSKSATDAPLLDINETFEF